MAVERELCPLLLIDDEPIRSRGRNRLNQRRHAGLVAEAARGTIGLFTAGVYSGWGEGKILAFRGASVTTRFAFAV